MPKINIDNKEIDFENGMTVMQACELAGVEIPRFCYHEKFKENIHKHFKNLKGLVYFLENNN